MHLPDCGSLFHHDAGDGGDMQSGESLDVTLIVFDESGERVARANERSTT